MSDYTKITSQDLELIFEANFEKIYRFFYYKVLSKEIAEDLTSEVFVTFANLLKEDKDIENPRNFLYGVSKNIFLRYLKQKYKQEIPISFLGDNFEEYIGEEEKEYQEKTTLEDRVLKYIDSLPDKQKNIAKMRLIDKLSLKEICEKLGKDMNYVKTTQKRAIKRLKELVELGEIANEVQILEE